MANSDRHVSLDHLDVYDNGSLGILPVSVTNFDL